MIVRVGTFSLALLLLLTPAVEGQRRPGPPPGNRGEMERRVQERFAEIVRVQLGLDAATARRLGEVVRSFQSQRQQLLRRERALRSRLRPGPGAMMRADPAPLLPEAEAREVLEEMRALREAEAELFMTEHKRLLEVLTPPQLVRFLTLREELATSLRRLRGGPPGGPGGWWPP